MNHCFPTQTSTQLASAQTAECQSLNNHDDALIGFVVKMYYYVS